MIHSGWGLDDTTFSVKFPNIKKDLDESLNESIGYNDISTYDTVIIKTPGNKNYDGRVGEIDYIDDDIVTVKFRDGLSPKMNNFDHNQVKRLKLMKQEDYVKKFCNNKYATWLDKLDNHDIYKYVEKEDAYHDYRYYIDYNNEIIIVDSYYIGESNHTVKESIIRLDDYNTAMSLIDDLGFNGALTAYNNYDENGYDMAYITGDDNTLRQFIDEYDNKIGELDLKIEENDIEESFAATAPTMSDLKSFFNSSDSLKSRYSNFFEWFDYMVKSGRINMRDLKNESVNESIDDTDKYEYILPIYEDEDLTDEEKKLAKKYNITFDKLDDYSITL